MYAILCVSVARIILRIRSVRNTGRTNIIFATLIELAIRLFSLPFYFSANRHCIERKLVFKMDCIFVVITFDRENLYTEN